MRLLVALLAMLAPAACYGQASFPHPPPMAPRPPVAPLPPGGFPPPPKPGWPGGGWPGGQPFPPGGGWPGGQQEFGGCFGCSYSGDYYGSNVTARRPAPPLRLQGQWRNGWWYY